MTGRLPGRIGLVLAVVSALASVDVRAGAPFDHDHRAWTEILSRHVRNGSVDYAALHRSGTADLAAYLGSLERVPHGQFESWTREQKLAFWINAYNAYTIRLILDHYPLDSIRSIGFLPGAAFRQRFIPLESLSGRTLSLNDVEHGILRAEFHEPRMHFAIVCASTSCPALRSEAYRADDLDAQLDAAARSFVRDATKNRFDAGRRTLLLSRIFDWFGDDFEDGPRDVRGFVAGYTDDEAAAEIARGDVGVEFLDYDWSLNGR